ncbi:MAG: HAD-IA family hydrolase [Acholeplasmatales bacterium]|nr:HAD-IA family hydrolase [Acholeplasmatales bacterium]
MIKYILFDLDGTLLDFKAGERNAFTDTINKFTNYKLKEEDILKFSDINERLFNEFASGKIKERIIFQEARFKEIYEYLGIDANVSESNKYYVESLKYQANKYSDVDSCIKYLYGKYKLYIASNGQSMVQYKRLETSGLDKYFEKYYISEDAGANKPDVEFFNYIFNDLNDNDKDSYVIIGDRDNTDILGGINAGIKTMLLNRDDVNVKYHADYEIKSLDEIKDIL